VPRGRLQLQDFGGPGATRTHDLRLRRALLSLSPVGDGWAARDCNPSLAALQYAANIVN